jgi:hypothetical protein
MGRDNGPLPASFVPAKAIADALRDCLWVTPTTRHGVDRHLDGSRVPLRECVAPGSLTGQPLRD